MPPWLYDLSQDACLTYYSIDLWCLFTLITLGNAVPCLKCVVRWYIHHALENAIQVYPAGVLRPTGNGGRTKNSKRLLWPAFLPKKLTVPSIRKSSWGFKSRPMRINKAAWRPSATVDPRLGHSNYCDLVIYAKGAAHNWCGHFRS